MSQIGVNRISANHSAAFHKMLCSHWWKVGSPRSGSPLKWFKDPAHDNLLTFFQLFLSKFGGLMHSLKPFLDHRTPYSYSNGVSSLLGLSLAFTWQAPKSEKKLKSCRQDAIWDSFQHWEENWFIPTVLSLITECNCEYKLFIST